MQKSLKTPRSAFCLWCQGTIAPLFTFMSSGSWPEQASYYTVTLIVKPNLSTRLNWWRGTGSEGECSSVETFTLKMLAREVDITAASSCFIKLWGFFKGAWGSVVVKALRCYSVGLGIDPRSCRWEFFRGYWRNHMCPGVEPAFKNEYQENSWG